MNEILNSIYKKILQLESMIKNREARDKAFQQKILDYFESEEFKNYKKIIKKLKKKF